MTCTSVENTRVNSQANALLTRTDDVAIRSRSRGVRGSAHASSMIWASTSAGSTFVIVQKKFSMFGSAELFDNLCGWRRRWLLIYT